MNGMYKNTLKKIKKSIGYIICIYAKRQKATTKI